MGYGELGYGEGEYGVTESEEIFGNIHLFEIFPEADDQREPDVENIELTVDLKFPVTQKVTQETNYKLPITHKTSAIEEFKIPLIFSEIKIHTVKYPIIKEISKQLFIKSGIIYHSSCFIDVLGRKPNKRIFQFKKTLDIEWNMEKIEKIIRGL